MNLQEKIIYLDNNSTTKVDERVIQKIIPILSEYYANASSSHHFGKEVNQLIKEARLEVCNLIGCEPSEIIFTSGATEAINLAIKGIALSGNFKRKKIVTVQTEHKAVLDTCKSLEEIGFEVVYLPVNIDGTLNYELLSAAVDQETLLVSAMFVNNETGVIHDIKKISEISHKQGALFFCDATQGIGKIPLNLSQYGVDALCFSGHKFHAPKGVGGLFLKNSLKSKISVQQRGGGQEFGIRSGTLNTASIIGLGEACKISFNEMAEYEFQIKKLRDLLETELLKIPGTFVNGYCINRIYNTSNICFPNNDANVIIGRLKNIAVSNGSACTSLVVEPSHVLSAMNLSEDLALSAIRFSLSKYNTEEDVKSTVIQLKSVLINLPQATL